MAQWFAILAMAAAVAAPAAADAHRLSMAGVKQIVAIEWQDASWDLDSCKRHGSHRIACSIQYYSDSAGFWQDEIFTLRGRSLFERTVSYAGTGSTGPPTVSSGPLSLVPEGSFEGPGEFSLKATVQAARGGWTGYRVWDLLGPVMSLRCPDGSVEHRELDVGALGASVRRDGRFAGTWPAADKPPDEHGMRYRISGRFTGLAVAGTVRASLTKASGAGCSGRVSFQARLSERFPRYLER